MALADNAQDVAARLEFLGATAVSLSGTASGITSARVDPCGFGGYWPRVIPGAPCMCVDESGMCVEVVVSVVVLRDWRRMCWARRM